MCLSEREGLLKCITQTIGIDGLRGCEQSQIGQILDARIRPLPWHRIRVEFFGDVRFNRIDPQRWWLDPRKSEDVACDKAFGLAEDWITKGDVDSEWLPIKLAGKPTFGSEPSWLQSSEGRERHHGRDDVSFRNKTAAKGLLRCLTQQLGRQAFPRAIV